MLLTSLTIEGLAESLASSTLALEEEERKKQQVREAALQIATSAKPLPVLPSDYKFLTSKAIDVTCSHEVECLVRDFVKLQKAVCNAQVADEEVENIFQFACNNGRLTKLIRVPSSTNQVQFQKNLARHGRRGTSWVDDMLDAMLPPPLVRRKPSDQQQDEFFDDEHGPLLRWKNKEAAAEALMAHLGYHYGAAFISASEKIGMPVATERRSKMDAPTAAAMWEDAGVYLHGQRVIHRYYINEFGHKFTVPEKEIKRLECDRVPPITGSSRVGDDDFFWWYKDPLQVITTKLKKIARPSDGSITGLEFNKLDIIIGGDHGQKAFRLSLKVILKTDGNKKVGEFIANIGEVDCKKDTAVVLRNTIFSQINERLKTIVKYTTNAAGKITSDGTLFVIKQPTGEEYFSFERATEPLEVDVPEKAVDLRVFITGDLAFYATVLGMENASASACWLCLLKKKEWEAKPLMKGELRTIAWICQNVPEGEQTSNRTSGVKEKPLLDAIETCRYIVPPLHTMLGVGNGLLTDFKEFVDALLEDTPDELEDLRRNDTRAENVWWDTKVKLDEWNSLNGGEMVSLIQVQKDIKEILEFDLEYGKAPRHQDIKELRAELRATTQLIKEKRGAQKVLLDKIVIDGRSWATCRKLLKNFFTGPDKSRSRYAKPVKSRLERVLQKHGIDYAAYHGGELVGNDCRKLMNNASAVTKDLEEVLLVVADEKEMSEETKESIRNRCEAFCHALVCFDGVFSLMFKANERVEMPGDAHMLQDLLGKSLLAWQNLRNRNKDGHKNIPPKVHALVQHLLDQFIEYGGIGDYDEQFVERSHQTGKDDLYRSRAIRCREARYKCFARWEEVRNHPQVMAKSEEVQNNRKRKFTGGELPRRSKVLADARLAIRTAARAAIFHHVPKKLATAGELKLKESEATELANAPPVNGDIVVDSNNDEDNQPVTTTMTMTTMTTTTTMNDNEDDEQRPLV